MISFSVFWLKVWWFGTWSFSFPLPLYTFFVCPAPNQFPWVPSLPLGSPLSFSWKWSPHSDWASFYLFFLVSVLSTFSAFNHWRLNPGLTIHSIFLPTHQSISLVINPSRSPQRQAWMNLTLWSCFSVVWVQFFHLLPYSRSVSHLPLPNFKLPPATHVPPFSLIILSFHFHFNYLYLYLYLHLQSLIVTLP